MSALSIIVDIVLILISIVLIVAVLMQEGQRQGLGAIGGGAETFFGKNKAKSMEGRLQKYTKIAAAVFIVLAIVATIITSHNLDNKSAASLDDVISEITDEAGEAVEEAEEAAGEVEEAAEDAVEEVEQAAEDAAEEVKEAAEDAGEAVEEAAEEVTDAAEDAVESVEEAVEAEAEKGAGDN